jgi:hypothetical protein
MIVKRLLTGQPLAERLAELCCLGTYLTPLGVIGCGALMPLAVIGSGAWRGSRVGAGVVVGCRAAISSADCARMSEVAVRSGLNHRREEPMHDEQLGAIDVFRVPIAPDRYEPVFT